MNQESADAARTPRLLRHYINGEFVASATTFADVSPVDGTLVAEAEISAMQARDPALAQAYAALSTLAARLAREGAALSRART